MSINNNISNHSINIWKFINNKYNDKYKYYIDNFESTKIGILEITHYMTTKKVSEIFKYNIPNHKNLFIYRYDDVFYIDNNNILKHSSLHPSQPIEFFKNTTTILNNIKQISTSSSHIIMLCDKDQIYVSGSNKFGQLGLQNRQDVSIFNPKLLNFNNGTVKQVVAGNFFSAILMGNGDLYMCGYNEAGQLGLGDIADRVTFVKVNFDKKIKYVSCENLNTIIITDDNEVYLSGISNNVDIIDKFTKIEGLCNIVKVACGYNHILYLNDKRELFASGLTHNNALIIKKKSTGNTIKKIADNVIDMIAGDDITAIIDTDFTLKVYGKINIKNGNEIKNIRNVSLSLNKLIFSYFD